MKKKIYVYLFMTLVCLAIALVPLTAAFGEGETKPDLVWNEDEYELSAEPGSYDSSMELTVSSSVSANSKIDPYEAENDCIKGVLIKGSSITTQEQLISFIQTASLNAEFEVNMFHKTIKNLTNASDAEGISEYTPEYKRLVFRDVLLHIYDYYADDEFLDGYIEDVEKQFCTSVAQTRKYYSVIDAAADKGLVFYAYLEKFLYDDGPIVEDNYIYYDFRADHGPEINVPEKTVTFHLEQYDEPTDYYLFILNRKTPGLQSTSRKIDTVREEYPIEYDEYSVYHYRIKGKNTREVSLPANGQTEETVYNQDLLLQLSDEDKDPGQKIYYTTDGTDPAVSATRKEYTDEGIDICGIPGEKTTIQLKIYYESSDNQVAHTEEYTYVIERDKVQAEKPAADMPAYLYEEDCEVTLNTSNTYEKTTTWYTLDGSDPVTSATRIEYDGKAIVLSGKPGELTKVVLKAYTVGEKNYTASETAEYVYYISKPKEKAATPSTDLKEGSYSGNVKLTLSVAEGVYEPLKIYYTLDGSDPASSDSRLLYKGPIDIKGEYGLRSTVVLKACAEGVNNYSASDILERSYIIDKADLRKESLSITTGKSGAEVTTDLDVIVTRSISYNGTTHVLEGSAADADKTADIYASVSANIVKYADPVFTVKKSKNVSKAGAFLTLKFKAKSNATAQQKTLIKQLNKKLKNKKIKIEFKARELTKDNIRLETLDNNKYKVIYIAADGSEIKLTSKNYKLKKKNGIITVSGKGNYTGKVEFK